jgi:hypothetical protein
LGRRCRQSNEAVSLMHKVFPKRIQEALKKGKKV